MIQFTVSLQTNSKDLTKDIYYAHMLQNTFYVIGIIYMSLMIIFMIVLIAGLFFLKKKINDAQKAIEDKLDFVKHLRSNSADIVSGVGAAVGSMAVEKVKGMFRKNHKGRDNE